MYSFSQMSVSSYTFLMLFIFVASLLTTWFLVYRLFQLYDNEDKLKQCALMSSAVIATSIITIFCITSLVGTQMLTAIANLKTKPMFFEKMLPKTLEFDIDEILPLLIHISKVDKSDLQPCMKETQDFVTLPNVNNLIAFRICNNKRITDNITKKIFTISKVVPQLKPDLSFYTVPTEKEFNEAKAYENAVRLHYEIMFKRLIELKKAETDKKN